jgi:transposase-like protein
MANTRKQTKSPMQKYTIRDFERDFPDDASCLEWLRNYLYPDGILCKLCGKVTKHHRVTTRQSYSCDVCGHHVHPTAGTIFHKTKTPLRLWFYAIYLMASTRCGISAKQMQRELGVTYKTAWRMFRQIRSMLDKDAPASAGPVEMDETYIGGKRKGKRGRGADGKTPVAGIVERKGRVVARKVENVKTSTLLPILKEHVLPDSTVYTDELSSYDALTRSGYQHKRVHHSAKIYVMADAHTNTIEGFWSLLKRGIGGVYHAVSAKHLQDYLNEYSFRYNHRNDVTPMFKTFLHQIEAACDGLPALEPPQTLPA